MGHSSAHFNESEGQQFPLQSDWARWKKRKEVVEEDLIGGREEGGSSIFLISYFCAHKVSIIRQSETFVD